jgi:formylmethanofuran dehydrogenase subunit E
VGKPGLRNVFKTKWLWIAAKTSLTWIIGGGRFVLTGRLGPGLLLVPALILGASMPSAPWRSPRDQQKDRRGGISMSSVTSGPLGASDNSPDWFYPAWAAHAAYNKPIAVRDTDSALGRYNLKTKEIGLKDIARVHGHMCDGLVIAFVEIRAVLSTLFPDGVVDRTDVGIVSKNGPCWADAAAFLTGARINFKTLRIDASIDSGFIIQRLSTGDTYSVHLRPQMFPDDQAVLERRIRNERAHGRTVRAEDIDTVERMGDALSLRLLTAPPEELLEIKKLADYRFEVADMFGDRGDVINKDMPRESSQ